MSVTAVMSSLFILLPFLVCSHVPVHCNVIDFNASSKIREQFDEDSMTVYGVTKTEDSNDMFDVSSTVDEHVSRYPLPNWIKDYRRNPFIIPYYTNMPFSFHSLNNIAYMHLNHLPYGHQFNLYQRLYQYPWKSSYLPDSDIQFSYLMSNPQAAMAYQGFVSRR